MRRIVLLYMPVIHRGYVEFLTRNATAGCECFLIGTAALWELGEPADYVLRKDKAIRGLPELMVRDFVRSLELFRNVEVLGAERERRPVLLTRPDEDIVQLAADRFFPRATLHMERIRLRYDRRGVARNDPVPATPCTSDDLHRRFMGMAGDEAKKSKDWWLSVGALISRDGHVLLTGHNQAAFDPDLPNILGDPRSAYARGENTEDSLALHAERDVVAQAAYHGISLKGTDAYVTHFPCVACAASLANAGVKRLYFMHGYSRLESAELLESKGVEIFRVL